LTFPWLGKSEDGNTITLRKLQQPMFTFPAYSSPEWISSNADLVRTGAAIDIETTGLEHGKDKIIEIGLRLFKFNRMTGDVLWLDTPYAAFEDPGMPLSEEVKMLTGIDDDMLKGQSIDWEKVHTLLSGCQLILAHNASFDRPFIDSYVTISRQKIWGCSFQQVDWSHCGFPSKKLEILSVYHGFFTDAHRALNDADAVIYLLSLTNEKLKAPYLRELLQNAVKPVMVVSALFAPFEKKDLLKSRYYRWDGREKVWSKVIDKDLFEAEIKWLQEVVYKGAFRGKAVEIQAVDRFKIPA
jgi:DNA polymerase-3 subunit epsilon